MMSSKEVATSADRDPNARKEHKMMTYADASRLARELLRRITFAVNCRHIRLRHTLVGSLRRHAPMIGDIDVLFTVPVELYDAADLLFEAICLDSEPIADVIARGKHYLSFTFEDAQIDFFLARADDMPYALLHHTGDAQFNIHMRHHATQKGFKLNQYGLFRAGTDEQPKRGEISSERDIFAAIDFEYKPPVGRIGNAS